MATHVPKYRSQVIGEPLASNVIGSPYPYRFPAFLKLTSTVWCIGNVALDGGVAAAEFVNDGRIVPLQDVKNHAIVLLKEADHQTDGFVWIWENGSKIEDRVRFSGQFPVYCPELKKVGALKKSNNTASFVFGQEVVVYEGDKLKQLLFLVKDKEGNKGLCVCKKCPLWNTPKQSGQQAPQWKPIDEDKWDVVRDNQKVSLAPYVLVDRKTSSTPAKYLASWCRNGEILIGTCWMSRGKLTSCFPTSEDEDHNSILVLQVPNERLCKFSYGWEEVDDVRICQNLVKIGEYAIGYFNSNCVVTVNTRTGGCIYYCRNNVVRKPAPPAKTRFLVRRSNNYQSQIIKGVKSEYCLEKALGSGTFGAVFRVRRMADNSKHAMKIEKKYSGEKVRIVMEAVVLKTMKGSQHFANFVEMSNLQSIVFLVMEILGPSVEDEQLKSPFPFLKALDVATQSLEGLRHLHESGFVHQDFKPGNMCFGIGRKINNIYIVDFGSARRYASPNKDLLPPPNANSYVGTRHFASKAAHEHQDQYPKEDLESWFYSLLEIFGGLPWGDDLSREQMYEMKCYCHNAPVALLQKLPSQIKFLPIWMHIVRCQRDELIDYDFIRQLLEEIKVDNRSLH